MATLMRRRVVKIKTALAILVSAVFLWLAVRQFDVEEFVSVIGQLHPSYILPALAAYLLSFVFRTVRWRVMLRTQKTILLPRLFTYIVIGFTANNLLPARLGEIVRAYVTGKREKMSRSSAFASVILERLFDGVTIMMLLVALMFVAGPALDRPWVRYLAWVSAALFVGGLGLLVLLAYQHDRALALATLLLRLAPERLAAKAMHILTRFVAGLSLLKHPGDVLLSILLSFGVWGSEVLVYLIYLKAFDIAAPPVAAFLALVVVNLSSLIPSSPGYIGVFQFACKESLSLFGVGATTALAWSVAIHATQVLPITLLGLVFLSRLGFSMREIRHVELDENGPENGAGSAP
ncbi:MAG: UPF0104 family protein [Myxococcales bacterium]|nr:MAG: UPF0104 family protein [Myxococcales bacterium]